MPDIQILDVLKTFLGGGIAIVLYRLSRRNNKKALKYQYAFGELTINSTFRDDVEIIYKGEKIEDASAVTIVIKNTGSVPIQKADFEGSMKLDLPKSTGIVMAKMSSEPENVKDQVKFGWNASRPSERTIDPLLLNPGDTINLFLLVAGFQKNVEITGRISGEARIERVKSKENIDITWRSMLLSLASLALFIKATNPITNGEVHWDRVTTAQQLLLAVLSVEPQAVGRCLRRATSLRLGLYRFVLG